MEIKLDGLKTAIIAIAILFIGVILFNGNKYLINNAVAPYEDSILVYQTEVKQIKKERNELERSYIVLEDQTDSITAKARELERNYKESLRDLKEVVQNSISLDTGEQQDYFDNRYRSDLVHTLHLDSVQGNDAINDIEKGDRAMVALLELQKVHITYKTYANNAGLIIANRNELIDNLNAEIALKDNIILVQEDEVKKLKRVAKRQGLKTKLVAVAGVTAVVGVLILTN